MVNEVESTFANTVWSASHIVIVNLAPPKFFSFMAIQSHKVIFPQQTGKYLCNVLSYCQGFSIAISKSSLITAILYRSHHFMALVNLWLTCHCEIFTVHVVYMLLWDVYSPCGWHVIVRCWFHVVDMSLWDVYSPCGWHVIVRCLLSLWLACHCEMFTLPVVDMSFWDIYSPFGWHVIVRCLLSMWLTYCEMFTLHVVAMSLWDVYSPGGWHVIVRCLLSMWLTCHCEMFTLHEVDMSLWDVYSGYRGDTCWVGMSHQWGVVDSELASCMVEVRWCCDYGDRLDGWVAHK